jgi:hypothetical protein
MKKIKPSIRENEALIKIIAAQNGLNTNKPRELRIAYEILVMSMVLN